jgi:hypothetical protein
MHTLTHDPEVALRWYCVIIVDGEPRDAGAVAFVSALRRAWREAGRPTGAAAFINCGSASRFTFLLSPQAACVAGGLLRRFDALPCEQAPKLDRYAPLRL